MNTPPNEKRSPTAKEYKARKENDENQFEIKRSLWKFPELGRERRKDLVHRLEEGAKWSFSFGLLTMLSAAIASLGLIQGSTGIVIGAMVVAPLMIPLIAAGLAVIQGNPQLFRTAAQSMGLGVLCALLGSVVIGIIVPRSDISTELLARANPNIIDLGVAFLAGFAAAYAVALPELLGALAGVAIAVALVPPLATTGIGLADGIWNLAYGAGLLFITNMVAIILGAAVVFRFFGLKSSADSKTPLGIKRAHTGLILLALMLTGLLGYKMMNQLSQGQSRPNSYPFTERMLNRIDEYLDNHRNIHYVFGGRSINSRGEVTVNIFLSSQRAIESDFKKNFSQFIKDNLGSSTTVRIHIFKEIEGSEATTFTSDEEGIITRK